MPRDSPKLWMGAAKQMPTHLFLNGVAGDWNSSRSRSGLEDRADAAGQKVIGISRSKKESKSRTVEESKKVETAALVGVGFLPGKGGATRRETSESPRSKKMSRMSRITRGRKMMKREGERGVSPGAEQKSRKPSQAKPVIQTRGRWGPHFMTPAGRHPVCQRVPGLRQRASGAPARPGAGRRFPATSMASWPGVADPVLSSAASIH